MTAGNSFFSQPRARRLLAASTSLTVLLMAASAGASNTGLDTSPTQTTLPFSIGGNQYMLLSPNQLQLTGSQTLTGNLSAGGDIIGYATPTASAVNGIAYNGNAGIYGYNPTGQNWGGVLQGGPYGVIGIGSTWGVYSQGPFGAAGNAYIYGDLSSTGTEYLSGNLFVGASQNLGGGLTVGQSIVIGQNLVVYQNEAVSGWEKVGGDFTVGNYVYAVGFFHTSDERLKENIQTSPGLDVIEKLRGVTFDWKKDKSPSAGVVAQEVEKVLPAAVHTDDKGRKTVEYDQLIAPLIESVKELKAQNDAQAAELAALKAKVDGK